MTKDQFWYLIAASRSDFKANRRDGNMDLQARRMEQLLSDLPPAEVMEFERLFIQFDDDAYRYDLWAAAYIINNGCSDDGFTDFRAWLISMGREVYEAAISNPESLANVAGNPGIEVCAFEEFGSIAGEVLIAKEALDGVDLTPRDGSRDPIGEHWEDNDLPERFPKLWAKFGETDA